MNENKNEKNCRMIFLETDDGMTVCIPEDKLESWEEADHNAPLNESQQCMVK